MIKSEGYGSMTLESNRRRNWDSKAVHSRTLCWMASRRTRHNRSVRHRRCAHILGRLVAFSPPLPHGEELSAKSTEDMRISKRGNMQTCSKAFKCQHQRELVRNISKRVFFLTGPRAKRHEEMVRHE